MVVVLEDVCKRGRQTRAQIIIVGMHCFGTVCRCRCRYRPRSSRYNTLAAWQRYLPRYVPICCLLSAAECMVWTRIQAGRRWTDGEPEPGTDGRVVRCLRVFRRDAGPRFLFAVFSLETFGASAVFSPSTKTTSKLPLVASLRLASYSFSSFFPLPFFLSKSAVVLMDGCCTAARNTYIPSYITYLHVLRRHTLSTHTMGPL
ncbi:hypothetical protein F4778DRAFT_78312 [Xylariomycetidae sp. FL2044]|nr:hypothetical protein F4778DRAFT_78312 [Xylariomycetidae sp. FL2044]